MLRHGRTEQRVYFVVVDAVPPEEFLSEREKEQLGGYKFAAKKQDFLLGRLAAKRALGALLAEPDLRCIEIRTGDHGQPLVQHPQKGSAEVTISHSHGLAVALAFPAGYPMGIDLETVSAVSAATIIGELGTSAPEQAWLATGGVDGATACCVLWTAREALGKALKVGLNSPLYPFADRHPSRWRRKLGRALPEFSPVPMLVAGKWGPRVVARNARRGGAELLAPIEIG